MKKRINVRKVCIFIIIITAMIFSLVSISAEKHAEKYEPLNDKDIAFTNTDAISTKTVVIDAGHGGDSSPGCIVNNVMEKHICLEIANKVKSKLEDKGYIVIMTRDKDVDVSLRERIEIANKSGAAVFVSIHQNSIEHDETTNGIETWFNPEKDECSKVLAKDIQEEIIKTTGASNKGVKESKEFAVIRDTNMASCLVETGFLTSRVEHKKLQNEEYQDKIADGIVNGIAKYVDF